MERTQNLSERWGLRRRSRAANRLPFKAIAE
jgi:hypothetical protein